MAGKKIIEHRLDLDTLSGDEFMAGWEDIFSSDFFVQYAEDTKFDARYSQLEFEAKFGRCMCTNYGPMTNLSMIIGRELHKDERWEICEERYAEKDFEPSIGWFTSVWVDVNRRWWNRHFPNDPVFTVVINNMALIRKLSQRNIPLVTSLKLNTQYMIDSRDWVMDDLNYWTYSSKRFGHCRTRRGLLNIDNYLNTYRWKSLADLEKVMSNGFESSNCFLFMKESLLSPKGKIYYRGMKEKLWNGENADVFISRYEISRIAIRLNSQPDVKKVKESTIWNLKDGSMPATIYEVSVMLNRANPKIPIYLGTDRNNAMTRGNAIQYIYHYLW